MEDVAPTTQRTPIAIRKICTIKSSGHKMYAGKNAGANVLIKKHAHGESITMETKMLNGRRIGATAAKVIQKKKSTTGSWCNQ